MEGVCVCVCVCVCACVCVCVCVSVLACVCVQIKHLENTLLETPSSDRIAHLYRSYSWNTQTNTCTHQQIRLPHAHRSIIIIMVQLSWKCRNKLNNIFTQESGTCKWYLQYANNRTPYNPCTAIYSMALLPAQRSQTCIWSSWAVVFHSRVQNHPQHS